ncbi:anti-sigma factor family protein [Paenibacillus sp. FA6]|uniref:anti-sigma factor family protein n=1 Tax=Paenibacillus sp. FA6 TaxID=3413029 RepID=UPI003F656513
MRCTGVVESMHRYLDNDLNEDEVAEMLGHIAGCQQCAEAFRTLKALTHELERLPLVVPKYSLVDAIMPQLDALDRARLEEEDSEELQPAEMIPVAYINKRKKRFPTTGVTRTLIGVAAAVGILGVAIYSYSPQQLSDAQIEYKEPVSTSMESNVGAEDEAMSMKTGGADNSATNDSSTVEDKNLSPAEGLKDELGSPSLDSTELEQETMDLSPVNSDTGKPSAPLKSDKEVVPSDSPKSNQQDPSSNPSSNAADEPSIARMVQPESLDSLKNAVEDEIPVDKQASEPLQASVVDPVPNKKRIMDDITGFSFSSHVAASPETASASSSLDSPDGTMSAVLENQKLVIYRLPAGNVSDKSVIQSIDLVGPWVMGEWSLDSTVFTYKIELDGKTSVYTYSKVAEVVNTP